MPKGLVFGALALLAIVVLGLMWMNNRSLQSDAEPAAAENLVVPEATPAAPVTAPAAGGPVVLTATEAVWISVKDGGAVLKQGELGAGQSYEVPANAVAPVLTTGKPEALRIAVGTAIAPAVGPAGETVSGVSLKAADLLKAASAPPSDPSAQAAPAPAAPAPARRQATARPSPATQAPVTDPQQGNATSPETTE